MFRTLLVAIIIFLCSCQGRKELPPEVLQTVLTIHTISDLPVKGKLFQEVKIDDQTVYISNIPVLSNKEIVHAEPIQYTDDEWGLKLRLTAKGSMRWQQIAVEFAGRQALLKIGGQVVCPIIIAPQQNREDVRIAAPFSKEEAEKISKDVIRNYEVIKEIL